MEEEYSDQNREAGRMKLKMHSKTSPNSRWKGAEEKKEESANKGEEESALVFKTMILQSVTTTL